VTYLFDEDKNFFGLDGRLLASGKVYFCVPDGTANINTLKTIYTTAALSTPASNPQTLTATGRFPQEVHGTGLYDIVIKVSVGGATVRTLYNVPASGASDAGDVTYSPSGTGAVNSTAETKLRRIVNIADYATSGNYDTARAALSGRNDLVVRPTNETGDLLLSAALNQARGALVSERAVPHSNFSWFSDLFTVTGCRGPGQAEVAEDIRDVFLTTHAANMHATTYYVHPSGSDANSGTTWRAAFLTLNKALRTTASGTVYIWPGEYDIDDFRYTDTSGDKPKALIAPFGGVTLRKTGETAASRTWQLTTEWGGVYLCHLPTTNVPIRVLRTDLLDEFGDPTPMPQAASLADLGANFNFGWAYNASFSATPTGDLNSSTSITNVVNADRYAVGMTIAHANIPGGTTITAIAGSTLTISAAATATTVGVTLTITGRALYVRDAMSANVQTTTKSSIDIIYGDSGGTNRLLLYSATLYMERIRVHGYVSVLKLVGQAIPQLWAKDCEFRYGRTSSLLVEGGYTYTQNCISSRCGGDGANYTATAGTTCRGIEINFSSRFAGDVDTYGLAQTLNPISTANNKNASSNHDSYVVRLNGVYTRNLGPAIADTAGSYSWDLGTESGHSALTYNTAPTVARYGVINQANTAWMDGCAATGNDEGFDSDSSATVYVFNCSGTFVQTSGGTHSDYVPT
jgi:hypothetical protein